MSDFNNIEFISETYKESNFKPKFYVIFIIVISIYYFFSPILSHFILSIITNNLKFVDTNFLYKLFIKFFIPNFSIFMVLIFYIFLIEERKIKFLFINSKGSFFHFSFKGIILSLIFLFLLIFSFILSDYTLSFKLNREFRIIHLIHLILIYIFLYMKVFFLECLYRGWTFNILSSRYSQLISVLLTSFLPVIIGFIEYQRIGFYLIYLFFFNVLLTLMFVVYKNILIVISFNSAYEFLKKYILSIESMNINTEPVFFTIINNTELYNIENNYYSLIILLIFISVMFIFHKSKIKSRI